MAPYRLPFIPVLSALHPDIKFCVSIKTSTSRPALAFSSCFLRMVQQVLCCVVAFRAWFFLIDTQTRISKRTQFAFLHFLSSPAFVYSVCFVYSFCLLAVIPALYISGLVLLSGVSRSHTSKSLSMNYSYMAESRGQAQTLSYLACQQPLTRPLPWSILTRVYLCLPCAWVKDMSLHSTRHLNFHMSPTKPTFSVLYIFLRSPCDVSLMVRAPN